MSYLNASYGFCDPFHLLIDKLWPLAGLGMDQVSACLLCGHNGKILVSHNGIMLICLCGWQRESETLDKCWRSGKNRRSHWKYRDRNMQISILNGSAAKHTKGRVGHGCMGHLVLAQRNQVGTVPEDGRDR